jgi:DNA-binding transcriptional LysR family regulator
MPSEHLTIAKDGTKPSRGLNSGGQGHLRALEKGDAKKFENGSKVACGHLGMIDLNLFRVFDAMMLHRSVRKASQILSVTPSALSHALNRLRQSIGDDLFVPSESGMQPTQRALELASAVREGLEKLELVLNGKESAPPKALRSFRIGTTDYPCVVILPSLIKRLAKSAPNVADQDQDLRWLVNELAESIGDLG